MLEVVKITYLKDTEYVYEGSQVVAVRHTDTGAIIPDEGGPYTEAEIRELLLALRRGSRRTQEVTPD